MKAISKSVWLLSLLFFVVFFGKAQLAQAGPPAQPTQTDTQNVLMLSLGDSITAGFLSPTFLDWFNPADQSSNPDSWDQKLKPTAANLPTPAIFQTPTAQLESRDKYSWASGQDISSQYVLLKDALQRRDPRLTLTVVNLAKTGGLISDVITQADQAVQLMASGQYSAIKYITLLIGNNDVCTGVTDAEMATNLHTVFQTLSQIKQAEPLRIMVSSIPNIPDLGEPAIKNSVTVGGLTCDLLRKNVTHTCLPLTTWTTKVQYKKAVASVAQTNKTLASAVKHGRSEFPNLQIVFSDRIYNEKLQVSDLALDCFHPNADAQQKISTMLWEAQPWFDK